MLFLGTRLHPGGAGDVPSVLTQLGVASEFEDQARALDVRDRHLVTAVTLHDTHLVIVDPLERADDEALCGPSCLRARDRLAKPELGLLPGEADEIALAAQRALDARRADFQVVRVRDEVDDVERRAQIPRDSRTQLEVNCSVARRQIAIGGARLFDVQAQNPASPLRLELDFDQLGTVRVNDRLDDALERVAIDSVKVGGARGRHRWGEPCGGTKKTRAPDWGPRV